MPAHVIWKFHKAPIRNEKGLCPELDCSTIKNWFDQTRIRTRLQSYASPSPVSCKFDSDPINNECASMETSFSQHAQGRIILK